jgi:hypothetical protein
LQPWQQLRGLLHDFLAGMLCIRCCQVLHS